TLDHCTVSGNAANARVFSGLAGAVAGGIANLDSLVLTGSSVVGNTATAFAEGGVAVAGGGGIAHPDGATLTLITSAVGGNSVTAYLGIFGGIGAAAGGGGIFNTGLLTVIGSSVSANAASAGNGFGGLAAGAGIFNGGDGKATISASLVSYNHAGALATPG